MYVEHTGQPIRPHDLWTAWHVDVPVTVALLAVAVLWARGVRSDVSAARQWALGGGLLAVALAMMSPIDALAATLLSGHMVQHVLLVAVAAPSLAWADPGPVLMRGLPAPWRRLLVGTRRRAGVDASTVRRLRHPWWRWGVYVAGLWVWHAAALYDRAAGSAWIHALEHATFLGGALLVWSAIVGSRRGRTDRGVGVLLAFLLVLQGVVLSALMTFSSVVWYDAYATPAPGWEIDPLTDQHLAGLIMWFPTGLIVTAIGIALAVAWVRESDADPGDRSSATRPRPPVLR